MAPCRLLSHWDPHSAWWPTQPTELGAQPSDASSPVQSMVLWSERAPRLVGLRVTRDITHQLQDPRSRHLAGGRHGGEPGQCSWNRGTKCGAGSPIPNNGDTMVPSLHPLGTFTRETLLHLRVAQRGSEGHLNQEEVIQVFLHLPSGSFLINHQGSCLVVPPNVGQSPMRFQISSWGKGQEARGERLVGNSYDVSMSGGAWTSVSPTDSVPKSLLTASLEICKVTGLGEQFTVVIGLGHPMGGDG